MRRRKQGFTLIELLVVIAIIGVLASVVLASLNASRGKSRNAAVLSQIAEYEKAINLYYAEHGEYPTHPSGSGFYNRRFCLGSGTVHNCWNGANFSGSQLTSLLVPNYMPSVPGFTQGELGSPVHVSCTGTNNGVHSTIERNNPAICGPQHFSLLFLLEGRNQDCGKSLTVDGSAFSSNGEYTLCRLNLN